MSTHISIPGYVVGTWVIDPAHSDVSFRVRFLGLARVRGTFDDFEGTIVLAQDPLDSSVNAVIRTASVNTKNKKRDEHLRHDDFLNAAQYPTMTFTSTGVRVDGDNFLVDGDLTLRAITKQVTLNLELKGFDADPGGEPLARFSARTEITCTDFGVTRGKAAAVVSDKDEIILQIMAKEKQD